MQKNYTYYLKLVDICYLITTDDYQLTKYLDKEYWLSKKKSLPDFFIKIKKTNSGHNFYNQTGKLIKKIRRSDIKGVEYFKYLDFIILLIIKNHSLIKNFLLFHGSAFKKNNKGYLFIGPVAAGKSTIIREIPKKNLLSDDTAVVKKTNQGFFLYPSPFDKRKNIRLENKPVFLDKIFILNKAKKNSITELKTEEKIAFLYKNSFQPESFYLMKIKNKKKQEKFFSLIGELLKQVKIYNLFFTKDFRPYWNLV